MSTIEWPVLWIEEDDDLPQIGIPELEWDGKPLSLPTVDDWQLTMGANDLHTLTVTFPVKVRTRRK